MSSKQNDLSYYTISGKTANIPFAEGANVLTPGAGTARADLLLDQSFIWARLEKHGEYLYSSADPCKPSNIKSIDNTLRNFFTFLKGLKDYKEIYFDSTIGEAQNLTYEIQKAIGLISGVLRTLVQRIRNYVIQKIKNLIRDFIENVATPFIKETLSPVMSELIDQVLCGFEKIFDNLANLVGDFLFALVNLGINNPVICATEAYINALLNNLANTIDETIQPILEQAQNIIGNISGVVGSVFSYINMVLGYEGLLCNKPVCPQDVANFKTGPFGGPQKGPGTPGDNYKKMINSPSKGLSDAVSRADKWLNETFPATESGGTLTSKGVVAISGGSVPCYTGSFDCGNPQLVFFGGGGSGASGNVIVNGLGQVIGVNLLNGGRNYNSAPFVTITDPAGCGKYASAYSIVDDDGKVIKVVLTEPGYGYSSQNNGGVPVIDSFVGSPNPVQVGKTVTLTWEVFNFDNLSLNIDGYTNITNTNSVSLVINESDVQFAVGSKQTTKTFTLTATKYNTNSAPQVVSQDYVFTVTKDVTEDETAKVPSMNSPKIDVFTGSPQPGTTLNPGTILTLSWTTTDAERVVLNSSPDTPLPLDGSLSVVVPVDAEPGSLISYLITATNTNINGQSQSVSEVLNYTIASAADGQSSTGSVPAEEGGGEGLGGGSTTTSNVVSSIDDIIILNSGVDYDPNDEVVINGGNNGATFELVTSPIGQIVAINVLTPGYGFTTIPDIQINSKNGVGAKLLPSLKFTSVDQLEKEIVVDPAQLVQVIDCVYK